MLKYEQLIQRIKQNIHDGVWNPGDKLPSDRIVCEQFDVSGITVRRAKNDLLAEGVLEQFAGRKGVFVKHAEEPVSTNLVGVAIDGLKDPFFANILHGIEDRLWDDKFHPILCSAYFGLEKLEAYCQSLLTQNVAGVILAPVKGNNYIENNKRLAALLAAHKIPLVLLDRYIPQMLLNSVVSDNRQASAELTRRLIKKGHRRILVLAGVECSSINDRLHGHFDALEEAGFDRDDTLVVRVDDVRFQMHQHYEEELARIRNLIEQAGDFSACYTMSSVILQEAIQSFFGRRKGPKKPIEIVTYDNNIQELRDITERVTYVKQPAYQMGWEAANLLIQTLDNPNRPITQLTLPSEIIEKAL